MEAKTLEALQGSIAKWEAIVDGTGANLGAANCPLCERFRLINDADNPCGGCPVMVRTKEPHCRRSPYYAHVTAEAFNNKVLMHFTAEAELTFLKRLLPKPPGEGAAKHSA